MGITVMRCEKCGKYLSPNSRDFCEKYDVRVCVDCHYLMTIGVNTIDEYNQWLRRNRDEQNTDKK